MYLKLKHQNKFQVKKYSHFLIICTFFISIQTNYLSAQNKGSTSTPVDTSDYIAGDINFNLIIAADKGYPKEVLRLLNQGASPNARTYDGVTPLLYAVQNDNYEVSQILLVNGANPDLVAYNDIPPLIIAVKNGNLDLAELLIRKDANIDAKDNYGITALMYASAFNNFEICDMLLYYEASVNIQDNDGNTALMLASYYGNIEIADLLIKNGATLDRTDGKGYTPLHCASQNGNLEIVKMLVTNGAGTEIKNNSGYSPLSTAVLNNNVSISQYLLDKGANPNSKISVSLRPLNLAKINKNDSIVNLLTARGGRTSYSPAFNYSSVDFAFNFSSEDFILGFGYSRYDSRYGLSINTGFSFRVKAIQVLRQASTSEYYQYWERRSFFHIGIDERIPLLKWKNVNSLGIGFGGQMQYHFSRYRGTNYKPEKGFIFVPEGFIYAKFNGVGLSLKYQHIDLKTEGNADTRINLGVHFIIRSKQLKHSSKKVLWYI